MSWSATDFGIEGTHIGGGERFESTMPSITANTISRIGLTANANNTAATRAIPTSRKSLREVLPKHHGRVRDNRDDDCLKAVEGGNYGC